MYTADRRCRVEAFFRVFLISCSWSGVIFLVCFFLLYLFIVGVCSFMDSSEGSVLYKGHYGQSSSQRSCIQSEVFFSHLFLREPE